MTEFHITGRGACAITSPLGPDGKHGDRHTPTCGCEDR